MNTCGKYKCTVGSYEQKLKIKKIGIGKLKKKYYKSCKRKQEKEKRKEKRRKTSNL